jgi:hypothetical protein
LCGTSSPAFTGSRNWWSWAQTIDGACGKRAPNTTLVAGQPQADRDRSGPGHRWRIRSQATLRGVPLEIDQTERLTRGQQRHARTVHRQDLTVLQVPRHWRTPVCKSNRRSSLPTWRNGSARVVDVERLCRALFLLAPTSDLMVYNTRKATRELPRQAAPPALKGSSAGIRL